MNGGGANVDRVSYPGQVIDRLAAALQRSTEAYPEGRRDWSSDLHVGFLERL